MSELQCRSATGRQSLLLVLWNTSLRAEALLALHKAGSWLWKLQRSQEQLGQGRQDLHFLKPLAVVVPLPFTQHMLNRYNSKCSCATANWMSWFGWNEKQWGVNSWLLLLWCLQLTYFFPRKYITFFFYRESRKKVWTQFTFISAQQIGIKACPCHESRAASPQESLLKAGKAGDTRDSCGLELCWHRIVAETALIT